MAIGKNRIHHPSKQELLDSVEKIANIFSIIINKLRDIDSEFSLPIFDKNNIILYESSHLVNPEFKYSGIIEDLIRSIAELFLSYNNKENNIIIDLIIGTKLVCAVRFSG